VYSTDALSNAAVALLLLLTLSQETLGAASICGADGEVVSPLLLAALAACQCGGILLDRLSPYAFEGGEGVPLTLHGSIGAGDTATVEVSICGATAFVTPWGDGDSCRVYTLAVG
jgi:hypothetical protein